MATKSRTTRSRRVAKGKDAECPHCGTECEVREGNGVYECPECGESFEVDLWSVPHVMQPDGITCGWATAKWMLSAFGCKMPLRYVAEMFCDRVAACKVYQKEEYTDSSALEYYNSRISGEDMHPETARLLGELLTMLAEKGEKETFRYIRRSLRKQKDY